MRESLSGKFKIKDNISIFLCLLASTSFVTMVYTPKEFVFLRTILLSVAMVTFGIMIAQNAAIWVRIPEHDSSKKENINK